MDAPQSPADEDLRELLNADLGFSVRTSEFVDNFRTGESTAMWPVKVHMFTSLTDEDIDMFVHEVERCPYVRRAFPTRDYNIVNVYAHTPCLTNDQHNIVEGWISNSIGHVLASKIH